MSGLSCLKVAFRDRKLRVLYMIVTSWHGWVSVMAGFVFFVLFCVFFLRCLFHPAVG
jgi:hypothetical protein